MINSDYESKYEGMKWYESYRAIRHTGYDWVG